MTKWPRSFFTRATGPFSSPDTGPDDFGTVDLRPDFAFGTDFGAEIADFRTLDLEGIGFGRTAFEDADARDFRTASF